MNRFAQKLASTFFLITALVALSPAAQATADELKVEEAKVRITIPGLPAAGYMTIKNQSASADALVRATSDKVKRIELHTHLMDDGIMRMRPVEEIKIPAGGEAVLKTGGLHLMLFGLDESVIPDSKLPITLTFKSGKTVGVDFPVAKAGATRGSHAEPAKTDKGSHAEPAESRGSNTEPVETERGSHAEPNEQPRGSY